MSDNEFSREIAASVRFMARHFPAVVVTGARQTEKMARYSAVPHPPEFSGCGKPACRKRVQISGTPSMKLCFRFLVPRGFRSGFILSGCFVKGMLCGTELRVAGVGGTYSVLVKRQGCYPVFQYGCYGKRHRGGRPAENKEAWFRNPLDFFTPCRMVKNMLSLLLSAL